MYNLRQFLANLAWSINNQLILLIIIFTISLVIFLPVDCGKLASSEQQQQQLKSLPPSTSSSISTQRLSTKSEADLCEICWCNKDSLACQKDNRLKSFPILLNETKRAAIKEM